MNELTFDVITKALDGLSLRAAVTAENIANANTPGYRPRRVDFEKALSAASRSGSVSEVTPRVLPEAADVTSIRLDLQMATASSTAGRYAALIELLNRQMQIDALPLSGNR